MSVLTVFPFFGALIKLFIWFNTNIPVKTQCLLPFANLSRPDPGQREKINLNIYFYTCLLCLKKSYEGLKDLHKTF